MDKRRVDKNKRVGERRVNSNGFIMTLIDYIDCNNVTVQFEDGEIVYNKYYHNFKKGNIKKEDNKYNINYNLERELSLGYLYKDIAKMIAIKENNLKFDDTFYILPKCSTKAYYQCSKCGVINKEKRICDIVNYPSCKYCSDGISIPEKFMMNILTQLNIKFTPQLSKSTFKWCNNYRYDFYIPIINGIIETNGEQHYKVLKGDKWGSLAEIQKNDKLKKELALINNIDNYIVIDCRYSELDWLKENVIKELSSYFDLSNIDWGLAWEESQNSLCVKTWELWNNNPMYTTVDISILLGLDRTTILKYVKIGDKIGKCKYEYRNNNIGKKNSKSIICITTKKIFLSLHEGANFYNCTVSGICKNCKRKKEYSGNYNGKKLIWRYLIWKHDKKYRIKP